MSTTKARNVKPARLQAKLPPELHRWAHDYAERKNTSVTQMIKDYFTLLKEKDDGRRARA